MIGEIIDALSACLISQHEKDVKGEPANIVDALFAIARALERIANLNTKYTSRRKDDNEK